MLPEQNLVQCHNQQNKLRYQPIDTYRGFAILGMVFFTVTLRLSGNLPDPLRHNVWGSIHLGDFILPMFLFASGLSLVFYLQKMENVNKYDLGYKVGRRFIKLALVGISLSFFSAYGFLEMDEVMLSALLFIACVVLSKLDWKFILGIIFFINLSYIILIHLNLVNIFVGYYLGGYPAALYYMPIMLVGLLIGRGIIKKGVWCKSNQIIISTIFCYFLLFTIFIPLNKMTATPSFIMLAILFSFLLFVFIEKFSINIKYGKKVEYLGKKPLRYWVMMYTVFLIPLWFYTEFTQQSFPLNIPWTLGILISVGLMILLYLLSNLFEYKILSN